MSWSISTFSAAKEMEEQTESAGVLFAGCYLQVNADVYPKHVCVHYVKSEFKMSCYICIALSSLELF